MELAVTYSSDDACSDDYDSPELQRPLRLLPDYATVDKSTEPSLSLPEVPVRKFVTKVDLPEPPPRQTRHSRPDVSPPPLPDPPGQPTSTTDDYVSLEVMNAKQITESAPDDVYVDHDQVHIVTASAMKHVTPVMMERKRAIKSKKLPIVSVYGTQSVHGAAYSTSYTPSTTPSAPAAPLSPSNRVNDQIAVPSTSSQPSHIPLVNSSFLSELTQRIATGGPNITKTEIVDTKATVAMEPASVSLAPSVNSSESVGKTEGKPSTPLDKITDDNDEDSETPLYQTWSEDLQSVDLAEYQTWDPSDQAEYLDLEEGQAHEYENSSVYAEDTDMYAEVRFEDEGDDGIYVDPNDLDSDHSTEYEASWGSSEFDSYSDEEEEAKQVKEQGQKVINKFKNWQLRRKSSVKDEELTFIEVQINDEKHPPPCLPQEPDNLSDNQRLRRQIVACILESENNYVTSLQRIVWDYEYALNDTNPPLIGPNKCNIIFYKVRHLLQMHYQFRIALSAIVDTWDQDEMIGQSFTASFCKGMVVDIYSDFVNNFSLATELVKRCAKTRPAFAQFLKDRQSCPDKLSLFGLLVKPIQRFPQFILLLQDLLKHTATDHPDRFNLQVALTELDNLAHKLNDRKRLSTQILEASQLFKNMDIRHVKRQSEDAPRLIRQDDITESHCTGQNQTPRWKPLRLSLLNDALLCTHPLVKNAKTGTEERHRLKWSVPLSAVTIKDSVITPDTNVALKGQPGHIVITSTRPPRGMESALYSELDGLIHDFTVITQVTSLVSSLKRSYQEVSEDSLQSLTKSIQLWIQTLDEHLRTMDSSSLQLLIRSKQGKRHVIVDFGSAGVKRKWLQELRMQEIASLPSNNPSWLDCHVTCKQYPLYITQLNLNITNEMNQIVCGAPFNLSTTWGASATRKFLWLCGCNHATPVDPGEPGSPGVQRTGSSTTPDEIGVYETSVVIVAVDAQNLPHVVESFKLCAERVTSCLVVKGITGMSKLQKSRRKNIDTVWMATENKTIRIHNLAESSRQKPLCIIEMSENVTQLVGVGQWIFAATDTGIIRIFDASRSDSWHIMCTERSLHVSGQSVDVLCWDGEKLWAGSGRTILTIDTDSMTVLRSFEVNQSAAVCYLARSGVGLFVGFHHRAQIQLYHTETFTHLQDINLASSLRGKTEPASASPSGDQSHVTCLSVIEHWLWIGTSIGRVLLAPLPRLEGVPLISSRALVSRHSHKGPVRFILSTEKYSEIGGEETSDIADKEYFGSPDSTDSLRKSGQKWRSMNDLDAMDQTDDHDRIKSLYSNLFGLKSEDLDEALENQFSASDSFSLAKGSLTLPAPSKTSSFTCEGFGSEDGKMKESDDYRLVLAGGEGYLDRKDHQGSDCGPNVQVWCSSW